MSEVLEGTEILVPDFGEAIHEAEVVEVMKEHGDEVSEGDELFTAESDKATLTQTADASGVVVYTTEIAEGIALKTKTVVGHIVPSDKKLTTTGKTLVTNPKHAGISFEGDLVYQPKDWQTDQYLYMPPSEYKYVLGGSPSDIAKEAAIVRILAYLHGNSEEEKKQDHADHEILLGKLKEYPEMHVGFSSLLLSHDSADFKGKYRHNEEVFEFLLHRSPILMEILKFPNVVTFNPIHQGSLTRAFELYSDQNFWDHFTYKDRTLCRK